MHRCTHGTQPTVGSGTSRAARHSRPVATPPRHRPPRVRSRSRGEPRRGPQARRWHRPQDRHVQLRRRRLPRRDHPAARREGGRQGAARFGVAHRAGCAIALPRRLGGDVHGRAVQRGNRCAGARTATRMGNSWPVPASCRTSTRRRLHPKTAARSRSRSSTATAPRRWRPGCSSETGPVRCPLAPLRGNLGATCETYGRGTASTTRRG